MYLPRVEMPNGTEVVACASVVDGGGSLALAASACPSSPSSSPSFTASAVICRAACASSTRIQVRTRRKVITHNPPVERAVPPVGSVWFGPAP